MIISKMTLQDFKQFWPVFSDIVSARETYAFDPNLSFDNGYQLWCLSVEHAFAIKKDDEVLGSYYLKPNASGPSSHICNCGYMVAPHARGKGIAKALCEHSQQTALASGYTAMQFNSVVSTNVGAIALWKKLGFQIIGTIPQAYDHRTLGLVDAYVMHKLLKPGP